ncbi:MAG: hypothetical protein IT345_01625 [Trueperaceae bacterium]|nr:hypothetical protein [Trueperaceae bacterium]
MAKAAGFMEAAELTTTLDETNELRDAFVTLWIHSGIASSDFICCKRPGEYHSSENHDAAVGILANVDQELAEQLRRLLRLKTKAAYSGAQASADDAKVAQRAATRLLEAARSHQ